MRLVLAALTRPLTLIVALIAIITGFFMAVGRMRMDIFPRLETRSSMSRSPMAV